MGIPIWLKPWLPNRDGVGRWSKIILLPFFCYFPAYLLVHSSFKSFEALTSKKAEQSSDSATLEQKVAELEKQVGIKINPTKNSMIDRVNSLSAQIAIKGGVSNVQANAVSKEYTVGLIEKEAKEQADKAASDAVDKAKSELISQISFPVLFAIASIFAAFAVKDILTEILKEQEREKIKGELFNQIPGIIEKSKFSERLRCVESSASRIEHNYLLEAANNLIGTIAESDFLDEEAGISIALNLLDQSSSAFDRSFTELDLERVRLLKASSYHVVQAKISQASLNLSSPLRNQLLDKIGRISDGNKMLTGNSSSYEKDLFDTLLLLCVHTLRTMKLDGKTSLSNQDLDKIIDNITANYQKFESEATYRRDYHRNARRESKRKLDF